MLVTKHAAELCAHLVSDIYGELPSRILTALLVRGRSHLGQLSQYTTLGLKHVRHGLGVLLQQNLLYHETSPDTRITTYEANTDACYNLVRSGKILAVIESQYGTSEREIVQMLMLSGHAKIADLSSAFEDRLPSANGQGNGTHESSSNGTSQSQLHTALARLIRADIIEAIRPDSFRNPLDVYRDLEFQALQVKAGDRTSTKHKAEQQIVAKERYREFQEQRKSLKRQLGPGGEVYNKRRKLHSGLAQRDDDDLINPAQLGPNMIVRLNHEKCCVELRNQQLAVFAMDALGEVTGEIYRALLQLLTVQLTSCRIDPLLSDIITLPQLSVTTLQVYEHLDEAINVSGGLGKAPKESLDTKSAEKIRIAAPQPDDDSDDSDAEPPPRSMLASSRLQNGHDSEGSEDEIATDGQVQSNINGAARPPKVKFDDEVSGRDSRLEQMRQHLLLLAESNYKFVRHCGREGRGKWTVDFEPLMNRIRDTEIDAFVEHSFGRHGLRLTRILREMGKLDEKMLPAAALMKKSEVQEKMLAMQMAGLVDVQEVPKDNSRMANRTLFFWFFDGERTQAQILDDIYKAMLRCFQTLQAERYRERNILAFVERKDVQGQEKEVMTAEHYNKYNRHLEVQQKLLGQVQRLDDVVAVLRDY